MSRAAGVTLAASALVAAVLAVAAIPLDVLAHFAPVWLAAGLASVAAAAALRGAPLRRLSLACGALAIVAGGFLMAPELLRPPEPAAAPGAAGQIKLIQFNAYKRNGDVRRVADWLIAQDPDIVTLQEARHDLRDELLRRTGWSVAGAKEHVMIFSREPRLRMMRPPLRNSVLTYMNATYLGSAGPFEVVSTHFDWPTSRTFAQQHADLARVTAALPRERMIVTGDFNTTPWSDALRRTDLTLGLRRVDRALYSWPAQVGGRAWPLPVLPIDHVYVGKDWKVVSIERGPALGSDHYPVVVVLAPVWRR
ncbi:MAG: endonuclease/exonuclease/phosphatase family protein [Pseudomonadota bacterium]